MFGLFKSKEQKSIDRFWKSEIGQRLTTHNEQYFGPGAVWAGFSPEAKQKISSWLLQRVFGVYEAANHIRSCTPHCKELAEELWRSPSSSDADLYS